ncbi:hypothetical protein Pcinc_002985 [Petrolisthes cinctipes]|uniref:Uncharacterized protein n=1 Tax=Petrolisthes cinctipes TaxID=88211 RepID=A0AAE1L2X5_PETCI|nr:hypothetical protein Pcinc_002985 [Petrolisthes cinctipes]
MTGPNFVPNQSDGPCLCYGFTSLNKPEELLCCELCRCPAHIACLGSDDHDGTLLADNFFTLVCQACAGVEHNAVDRAKMSTFKQEKRPQSKASTSRAEPNAIVCDEEVINK